MPLASILNQASNRWWDFVGSILKPIVRILSSLPFSRIKSYNINASINQTNPSSRIKGQIPYGDITNITPKAR
jgi:hypothetical protein